MQRILLLTGGGSPVRSDQERDASWLHETGFIQVLPRAHRQFDVMNVRRCLRPASIAAPRSLDWRPARRRPCTGIPAVLERQDRETVRFGLVGYGLLWNMGRFHAEHLEETPGLTVAAIEACQQAAAANELVEVAFLL